MVSLWRFVRYAGELMVGKVLERGSFRRRIAGWCGGLTVGFAVGVWCCDEVVLWC